MGTTSRKGHAVIIGASIGGVTAAAALAESFERITIIDRDELPATAAPRRGVPQGRLTHGLTARGEMALGELFPGLVGELAAIGAPIGDVQSEVNWYIDGRRLRRAESGLSVVCASRPLLEFALRARIAARPDVTIISRHDVTGLLTSPDQTTVTGVRLRDRDGGRDRDLDRDGAGSTPPSTMAADLVVDATGLGTGSASWLKEHGYAAPEKETVRVGICYSCRIFRGDTRYFDGGLITVVASYPDHPLGGLAIAQEGGRIILSLTARGNIMPPTDLEEMALYADTLPNPGIAEIIRTATPLGEPVTTRFPASVRRRYERLDRFLGGFLAVGDALCCLNPVYGQGMSVAAAEALALRDLLRDGREDIARRFFRAAEQIVDIPWTTVLGNDLRFPDAEGPRTPELERAREYMDAFRVAAADDLVLSTALVRVLNMVDAPSRLRAPELRERVARTLAARSASFGNLPSNS
jgi:2-polyprenyl-6-methoxyphenol hydroxylase-like FAD-dependent oxidoreductase